VQDNYVVQWGDPDGEDAAKARALPEGLLATSENDYTSAAVTQAPVRDPRFGWVNAIEDPYGFSQFWHGWPLGRDGIEPIGDGRNWPVHCYGMVGVGRNYSPDAGTGAELYTVIGHAPRQLDRNIALVGRVIEGIENLSSLPRGTGPLGFYETAAERTPIASVRLASELPAAERPRFEYLSTEGPTFARYAEARANRRDPFFIVPAGGADVCNVPVPIRRVANAR
jgi:peptidylprolyl isomerase